MKNKNTIIIVLTIILFISVYFVFFKKKKTKITVNNTIPGQATNQNTGNNYNQNNGNSSNQNTGNNSNHQGVFYSVKKGDTLSKIASRYSITLSQILKLNPSIKNPNLIFPGQKIKIS